METYHTVMMKPQDKVAVALAEIPAGALLHIVCQGIEIQVELTEAIEFGHKFAVVPIEAGEDIIKYGEVIGMAVMHIGKGEHVHVHNLEGKRGRGDLQDAK